jgi:uncharacterized protein (TIGR01777 family)
MPPDGTASDRPFQFLQGRGAHVLVTGGTGFIGHALVPALADQGVRVTVLTRRDHLPEALRREQVRAVRSLADIPASEVVDAVINLAGARILGLPWTAARREELLRSRVGTTHELVAWIADRGRRPRCLLSASAIGYYGVQPPSDDTPLAEDSPPQPIFMSQLCQQWEQAAAAALPLGVRVGTLRFGVVLGQGGALPMLLLPVRLGLGGRLGSGQQWLSWVHIDDLLRALAHAWQALEREPGAARRIYNVTAPAPVRQGEFSRIAAGVLRRPNLMPTPAWPVRLLLGEQADLLLEGQRVVPARLQREGFTFRHPQLRPALESLVAGHR